MSPSPLIRRESAWPHRWAVVLACATFPLVWWGGFVSATGSGMAFRDWLTADGTFLPFYPWFTSAGDKFIEHGHRVLAMIAGVLTITLAAVCWRCESRRWVRWYSLALVGGVIAQGVLGGMRVVLDERVLAVAHGCTGPLFFAAAVGMAVVTSRWWRKADAAAPSVTPGPRLLRLAIATAALSYLQLVVGTVVRHSPYLVSASAPAIFQTAVYFHLVLAAAVVVQTLWLAVACWRSRTCVGASFGLAAMLWAQVLLGAGSWIVKYGMPGWTKAFVGETGHFNRASDLSSAAIAAGHGAVGALVVALCVAISLHVGRCAGLPAVHRQAAASRLVGALG